MLLTINLVKCSNDAFIDVEYDLSFRESDKTKLLQELAVEYCELPKGGLALTMSSKKKAMEIRYTTSSTKLSFMACALLNNQTRMVKQSLLETDDLKKRMDRVIDLLKQEIEVLISNILMMISLQE